LILIYNLLMARNVLHSRTDNQRTPRVNNEECRRKMSMITALAGLVGAAGTFGHASATAAADADSVRSRDCLVSNGATLSTTKWRTRSAFLPAATRRWGTVVAPCPWALDIDTGSARPRCR
jgi:hypothetical protein